MDDPKMLEVREELRLLKEQLDLVSTTVDMIDDALFEVPPGSPEGEQSLVQALRIMWRLYQRMSWITRVMIWVVPAFFGALAYLGIELDLGYILGGNQ